MHQVAGEGHFRDIKLVMPDHTPERLFHWKAQIVQIDPVRYDIAQSQRAGTVVVATCQGQLYLAHKLKISFLMLYYSWYLIVILSIERSLPCQNSQKPYDPYQQKKPIHSVIASYAQTRR